MTVYIIASAFFVFLEIMYLVLRENIMCSQRRYVSFFIAVVFSIIVAFRPEEVRDTANYIKIFNESISYFLNYPINWFGRNRAVENGWWYLTAVLRFVLRDYRLFFLTIALWNTIVIPKYLTKIEFNQDLDGSHEDIIRGIYVISMGVLYSGLTIRAGFSLSLALWGIYLLRQRKYLRAVVLFLLTFSIHNSMILMICFALVEKCFKKQSSNKMFRLVIFMTVVMLILMLCGVSGKINAWMYSKYEKILAFAGKSYLLDRIDISKTHSGYIRMLYFISVCSLFIFAKKKSINVSSGTLLIAFGSTVIMFVTISIEGASRIYDMALLFTFPIIEEIYKRWSKMREGLSLCYFLILMLVFAVIKYKTAFF